MDGLLVSECDARELPLFCWGNRNASICDAFPFRLVVHERNCDYVAPAPWRWSVDVRGGHGWESIATGHAGSGSDGWLDARQAAEKAVVAYLNDLLARMPRSVSVDG